MRDRALLPAAGRFYKANLHCHTVLSDGRWTKEQVKAEYQRRGYSIVAFTDHRHYGWHPELMDDGFVPLAAYEADLNEPFPPSGSFQRVRTYHLNFYDTDPVARGGFEAVQPPQRYGDMEALNGFIARMNGDGFLLHGGLKDGVTSWVPSMIQSNFGASPAFSAAVSMVLPLVNLTGAYLAGWLDHRVFRNEVKTSAALMGLALACLLALPMAVQASLPVSLVLLAATTALMLGVNTMFINVMPVKIGRSSGAAVLSGSLNAITYLGAALATWGIGAAAEGFGWGAVFVLWAVMAGTALAVCLLLARPWGRFVRKCEMERGDLV